MKKSVLVLFLVMLPLAAFAADAKPKLSDYPVLEKIKRQGPDGGKGLTYDYMGKKDGMDAWMISGRGAMQMVFTSPGSTAAIVGGMLIDSKGQDANSELQQNFARSNPERARDILVLARGVEEKKPIDKKQVAEDLWKNLGNLGLIRFGTSKSAPEIYALLDPAQPESKQVWLTLDELARKERVQVRVVPLAIVSADNIMTVVQVLGADDPQAAWRDLIAGKSDKLPESPPPKGVEGLKKNVTFAQKFNLRKLPFIFYKQGDANVRVVQGAPKNWDTILTEINSKTAGKSPKN